MPHHFRTPDQWADLERDVLPHAQKGLTQLAISQLLHMSKETVRQTIGRLRDVGQLPPASANRRGRNWSAYDGGDHSKPPPDRRYQAQQRRCLKCRAEFKSLWPGDRVCPKCESTQEWKAGV